MRAQKAVGELNDESFEIEEYIRAFKSSTDRARYMVFINTAVCVLILVCTWNMMSSSWSMNRIRFLEAPTRARAAAEFDRLHPGKVLLPPKPSEKPPVTRDEWEKARQAFIDEAVARERVPLYRQYLLQQVMMAPIPGLGVHIHSNDIGVVGGFALLILMLLLTFAMVREHENLNLSLFKITRLCERTRNSRHDGESTANFLYHAMVMGQVLSSPPTLWRWGYGYRTRLVGYARRFVIFLPAVVQGFVLGTNWRTFKIAFAAWQSTAFLRMSLQVLFFFGIVILCKLASAYSSDCNRRWRKAFDYINPGLPEIEPPPRLRWLGFRGNEADPKHLRPLIRELTYSLRPDVPPTRLETTIVDANIEIGGKTPRITREKLQIMATELHGKIEKQVHGTPERYQMRKNTIEGSRWYVELECEYRPGHDGGFPALPPATIEIDAPNAPQSKVY